jgi:hypothetical protein
MTPAQWETRSLLLLLALAFASFSIVSCIAPAIDREQDVIRDLPIDLLNFEKNASGELDLGNAGSQEGDD